MKRLKDEISLKGKSESISISEFRAQPGSVLQQVELGKRFDVTRQGKIVATISPPELNAFELGKAAKKAGIVK